MASYRQRIAQDLERWIASGLVPETSRQPILDAIPEARRLDAATALAWVGAVLGGLAVIAFISANWDAIPRILRFAFVLGVFGGAAGGAAWCHAHARPHTANGLLAFAALAFAAAIGVTGQIFDIVGDTRSALYAAGIVAAALALSGRASAAMIVGLFFFGAADDFFAGDGVWRGDIPWLVVAAPLSAALAIRWRSTALAHASALGVIAAAAWLASRFGHNAVGLLVAAAFMAAAAAGGRWLARREDTLGSVFYGWFVWGAFAAFIAAGYAYDGHALDLVHRIAWLAAAGAAVALGRSDRHAAVTAAGVLGLIGSVSAISVDLGVNLLAAAAVFFVAAMLAGGAGLALRRMRR